MDTHVPWIETNQKEDIRFFPIEAVCNIYLCGERTREISIDDIRQMSFLAINVDFMDLDFER